MKKLVWICLNVFLVSLSLAEQKDVATLTNYKSDKYQVSFSYPKTWILEGETADNNLLSLYSPEALSTRQKTPLLVLGIKTEIYFFSHQQKEVAENFMACHNGKKNTLSKKNQQKIRQCRYKVDDLFIVASLVKTKDAQSIIIGYIPEKSKIDDYLPAYTAVVLSFSYLKSGSP